MLVQTKKRSVIEKIYENLLCLFIIVAPINNLLNSQGVYATITASALAVLATGCMMLLLRKKSSRDKSASFGIVAVVLVLLTQLLIFKLLGRSPEISVVLPVACFCLFATLPGNMPLKRIYCAV